TDTATRSKPAQHGYAGISDGVARKDRRPGGRRAIAGRPLSGILRGLELTGTAGGESAVLGTHRLWQDTHCGSGRGDSVWRRAISDQGRLRGIPAFPRNRKADWFAAWVFGASR